MQRRLIRTITPSPIHEWIRGGGETAREINYRIQESPIPTMREDHELQGWSRLRDFLGAICCRRRERERESRGICEGKPPFGIPHSNAFWRQWRIHLYLSRDPFPRFTFPLFVEGFLYAPLDRSPFASINRDSCATILFALLTLYTRIPSEASASASYFPLRPFVKANVREPFSRTRTNETLFSSYCFRFARLLAVAAPLIYSRVILQFQASNYNAPTTTMA